MKKLDQFVIGSATGNGQLWDVIAEYSHCVGEYMHSLPKDLPARSASLKAATDALTAVIGKRDAADALAKQADAAPFVPSGYANETEFLRQQLSDSRTAMKAAQAVIAERDAALAQRVVSEAVPVAEFELKQWGKEAWDVSWRGEIPANYGALHYKNYPVGSKVKLYTTPPAAPMALSDAEILKVAEKGGIKVRTGNGAITFARAILAAATQPTDADKRDAELLTALRRAREFIAADAVPADAKGASQSAHLAREFVEYLDATIAASAKEAK